MNKTIRVQSGHMLFVESVELANLPTHVQEFKFIKDFKKHYVVKNWDSDGVVFFYIATDSIIHKKREFVVWYRGGGFWSGYGHNLTEAINGAQEAGWMYA